jgi:hypothetical protein
MTALVLARGEIYEIQYLFQEHGSAFQTSSLAGGKINLWRNPAFKLFHNIVVLLVRQLG